MAESKNNFTNSKMNRDLDARLVPRGQYREGTNVNVSTSESDDVGTLQNVLGNVLESNFNLQAIANLNIIGQYVDDVNSNIYVFLTNYTDSSTTSLENNSINFTGAKCYIVSYNINSKVSSILVEGNFLNFSKTHYIYGINLIEDLLFWTDNRNQPRKINIVTAAGNSSYYNSEDKISVAKFYPSTPAQLYREIKLTCTNSSSDVGVAGRNLEIPLGQLATGNGIWGITQNMMVTAKTKSNPVTNLNSYVESVNYPFGFQPVKNAVRLARPGTWNSGDIITFTEYGLKDCVSEFLPYEFEAELANGSLGVYEIASDNLPLGTVNIPLTTGMHASCEGSNSNDIVEELIPTNVTIVVDNFSTPKTITFNKPGPVAFTDEDLTGKVVKFFKVNPNYNANYPGDENYLKDKFIRFSYRYKFDDGEYSLIAPFTQIAFIPEEDGYLINKSEEKTATSSVMANMENKVNCVNISLYTPFVNTGGLSNTATRWKDTIDYLNIDSIEILCSLSTETSIRLIERLDVQDILSLSSTQGNFPDPEANKGNSNVLTYVYNAQKPAVTLPSVETTRVFDKVPIRALAQESAGNRIMYGNFRDKHTSPDSLNFRVSSSRKVDLLVSDSQAARSLPTHTLKENRTYQVGIVLADRYGRQSDVILSNVQDGFSSSTGANSTVFGESTHYSPYGSINKFSAVSLLNWPGDQLFLYLNQPIPETISKQGYPGFYSESNPLGWYTYKIVVKQQEQEYYNVFTPSAYREDTPVIGDQYSYISLVNDNINKIPKNLSEVGPLEKSFSSSTLLHPRVNPIKSSVTISGNTTDEKTSFIIFPLKKADKVDRIIYNNTTSLSGATPVNTGLEVDSGKLYMGLTSTAARISNEKTFGLRNGDIPDGTAVTDDPKYSQPEFSILGVYETNPVVSDLEIYWETSTAGFISDINADINVNNLGPVSIAPDILEFFENTPVYIIGSGSVNDPEFGTVIFTIEPLNAIGAFTADQNATCVLNSVISSDTGSNNLANDFIVTQQLDAVTGQPSGRFNVFAKSFQYYRLGREFTFGVTITANSVTNNNLAFTGQLSNVAPQFPLSEEGPGQYSGVAAAIPFDYLTYKNYSRTDLGGNSLRPSSYPSPFTGSNYVGTLGGISFTQATVPLWFWLDHSTTYMRTSGTWNDGSQVIDGENILSYQFLFDWGLIQPNIGASFTVPAGTLGFPFQNADTTVYWSKGYWHGRVKYITGTTSGTEQWAISEKWKDVSYLSTNDNQLTVINGTLAQSFGQQNLVYSISEVKSKDYPNNTSITNGLQEVVTINSQGIISVNSQGFIDRFGQNGSIFTLMSPAGVSPGPITFIDIKVLVTDADLTGPGALSRVHTFNDITIFG